MYITDVLASSVASVMAKYLNSLNHLPFNFVFLFNVPETFISGKLIARGSREKNPLSYPRNFSTEMTVKQAKPERQKCKREKKRNEEQKWLVRQPTNGKKSSFRSVEADYKEI